MPTLPSAVVVVWIVAPTRTAHALCSFALRRIRYPLVRRGSLLWPVLIPGFVGALCPACSAAHTPRSRNGIIIYCISLRIHNHIPTVIGMWLPSRYCHPRGLVPDPMLYRERQILLVHGQVLPSIARLLAIVRGTGSLPATGRGNFTLTAGKFKGLHGQQVKISRCGQCCQSNKCVFILHFSISGLQIEHRGTMSSMRPSISLIVVKPATSILPPRSRAGW